MSAPIFGEGTLKRERFRRARMDEEEKQEIVERVLRFKKEDIEHRADDRENRLQRYAKYRQWTEGKDLPWENSSDVALPDITEAVLNTQDTLTNAILSTRPVVGANALKEENSEKEVSIDKVLDSQFFIEQPGEKIVEELGELFLVDGKFTAYIPWIREVRNVTDLRIYDPIPPESPPITYFEDLLAQEFGDLNYFLAGDKDGWDYRVQMEDVTAPDAKVHFYTRRKDNHVEMIIDREVEVFNGPRVIVKEYDDVLVPPRAANLQMPGPSNPGGAPHVILMDYPLISEIEALKDAGFYDLARSEEEKVADLGLRSKDTSYDEAKQQKDVMQGVQDEDKPHDREHRPVTRLMCFDVYDLNGDGKPEDVIFWVLEEDKILLKATPLTEMFPADPPRRPLAEAQYLPVKGRHEGISLPELMEGMHDYLKETLDQGMDGGTLATTPFFFYRAASSIKPEIIRPWPGDGVPISDPQRDIFFPQIPFDGSFALNAFALGKQQQERLTLVGDLQAGRVPTGKSSALRTVGGINTILAQGEARPERVLRRFFMGFAEIYKQMHELNQHFFPEEKQIRVLGLTEPGENPYPVVVRQRDLNGRFVFDFRASVLNASKVAKQQGLQQLLQMAVNPLLLQLGVVGPTQIFRMIHDFVMATGQDPQRYLQPPQPGDEKPRLTANEAISVIFDYLLPDGLPAEPTAQEHVDQLQAFMQDDKFGLFDQAQLNIFKSWLSQVTQLAQQEKNQQELASLAESFQQKAQIGAGGNGAEPPVDEGVAPLGPNELSDETLPGNGRGV
jgi:hypothetical protein